MEELELVNELKFFHKAEELLRELKNNSVIPFMVICDINLSGMDGFQLREEVLKDGTSAKVFHSYFGQPVLQNPKLRKHMIWLPLVFLSRKNL